MSPYISCFAKRHGIILRISVLGFATPFRRIGPRHPRRTEGSPPSSKYVISFKSS